MSRPSKRPKTAYKRLRSPLNALKNKIERLYRVERWTLESIRTHIRVTCGTDQSPKQYKDQLKSWGIKKNHTCRDAAFILRLLNRARAQGRPQEAQIVLFSSFPRRREDIQKYIKRSKLVDEAHLLSKISDEEETPNYIKLPDTLLEQTVLETSQNPLTPPSGVSGHLIPPPDHAEVPPLNLMPSPELSPRSSSQWSGNCTPSKRLSSSASDSELDHMDLDPEPMPMPPQNTVTQPTLPKLVNPFGLDNPFILGPNGIDGLPLDDINALLSSTPASIDQFGLGFDITGLGVYTHSRQLNDGSFSALFVTNCLYWLICVGQEKPSCRENAPYHLDQAKWYFIGMIQDRSSPGEACIGALSVASVLFECLGHTERLAELLGECDQVTRTHLGDDNPLRLTIAFKKNLLQRGGGCSPLHDVDRLRYIHHRMECEYPKSRGPVLMAKYHLVWAMLENELKKDRRLRDLRPAKEGLEVLLKDYDAHLGSTRIETIMAATTLARATFRFGDAESAEEIIVNEVFPRLRENFPEDHPYTWEAKHRHAYFLLQLAKADPGPTNRTRLQQGEQLLREVVRHRRRVLGEGNPKSIQSFALLKFILEKQDKVTEAKSLWWWCERQV
ncbi:hypothetical protein LTR41_007418 [Exophiala xenobiotica]|nr:hypothetical protein LTR41_007418 [Exophiala xenobiotica]